MTEPGVIPRASLLLHAIAQVGPDGARLTDLVTASGLSRPTVHRILKDLAAVGLVSQDEESARYLLGSAIVELALSAPTPEWDLTSLTAVAQELADDVGDTVYVSTRDLNGVRYLVRAEGSYPVRALMVNVGDVKPFTSSYSGLALLSATSPESIDRALAAHLTDAPEGWWDDHPTEDQMRAQIVRVQREGFCGGPGLVIPGVSGMAAPVPIDAGLPRFAISISAVDARLDDERIIELAPLLLDAAKRIAALQTSLSLSAPTPLKESA